MQHRLFYKLGLKICHYKYLIIMMWLVLIACTLPFLPHLITPFQSTGFVATHSESDKADKFLKQHLDYYANRFIVLYSSKRHKTTSSTFKRKVKYSLRDLKKLPFAYEVFYPYDNKDQQSKNKRHAYAVIAFKDNKPMSSDDFAKIKKAIKKPRNIDIALGGEKAFVENVNQQSQRDIFKADMVAAPVAIVILILVFGSVVAALIPIVLGGGCALIILTSLYFLANLFDLSIFTLNIALLLGLCLSLDYALFIVYRFRDEYRKQQCLDAMAVTMATAGKAVFYSGLTVFISLSALLFFPVNILFSLGVGGLVAVGFAVAIAITLLPAVLCLLKERINAFSLFKREKKIGLGNVEELSSFWSGLAKFVVAWPKSFFLATLAILLLLGYPFLNAEFGISDYKILPNHSESRQFYDGYKKNFDAHELTPIQVIVSAKRGKITYRSNLNQVYWLARKIKRNPLVEEVQSIVTTKPKLTRTQYYQLYKQPKSKLNDKVKKLLKTTTTKKFTVFTVVSKYDANSSQTRQLIKELRAMKPGYGLTIKLAGVPVMNMDVKDSIADYFPIAIVLIMSLTYFALLILLRSLFLPLKAILMNILSLCASYGVLVFVFQEGHLHEFLNFEIQGMLDISLLVIIFCALFGFSMDYEVFLLTRIQEYYLKTRNNKQSIIFGIAKSSRIITSAALIVIFICGSFMVADVLMVKAFGLGIAVAIFVDAFIIRTLFVPATMVLLSGLNWYIPAWLDNLLPGKVSQFDHH